jgi:hypothetical protein
VASIAYPTADYNAGAVTQDEHEQLTASGLGSGIIGHPDTTSQVAFADGTGTRAVFLRAERRVITRGFVWYSGASAITMNLSANAGATRIDRIVLRLDRSAETITETIITGTPGSGTPPTLVNAAGPGTGVWDFPLARVTVVNGATTIAAEDVVPEAWYVGGNPIVVDISTRLPSAGTSHMPPAGTMCYVTSEERILVSTGTDYQEIHADTGWLSIPMQAGWGVDAFSVAQYRKKNGVVYVTPGFKRTGASLPAGTASAIALLPTGFWPAHAMRMGGVINQAGYDNAIGAIATNGGIGISEYAVTIQSGKWLYFPTVSYPAVTS